MTYWLKLAGFLGVVSLVAGVCLLGSLIYMQVQSFLTPGRGPAIGTPEELGRPYETITLTTQDGLAIAGWYIEGTTDKAVILVHGIHANRGVILPEAKPFAEAGYHLVLIDQRAHGESEGTMTSYGYYETFDVLAAVDYLAATPGVAHIGVKGISMGGSAAARAFARDDRIEAGAIAQSFSSMRAAIETSFDSLSVLPKWPFAPLLVALCEWQLDVDVDDIDSARDLATVSPRPVLIIQGEHDDLFAINHGQTMYEAIPGPKEMWVVENQGHGSPAVNQPDEYGARVVGFFDRAFAGQEVGGRQ